MNSDDRTAKATSQNSNTFDVTRVINRLDRRTTFMIKNIPNKYDQAMLMEWVDATHKGTYDFLYLRIDFKNKCNVGYAFINFIDPESVIYFAQARQGKLWNRFNSEKICELAYAKIQGKASLIKKFQNSCVMEQEVAFRPKIFYSSGDRQGEEEVKYQNTV
ncbi:RNA recognition motif 2-domain-containing protein [Absidia repens]|uniref:RNA recognition motif 2-domain-containing protein n=1 Tax=Absidia repens TaxID=90262 RepID=A0A1X2IEH9_9FUNG|nr:RNA recognition motif 2-domain-containing protein [Absidia repens]